MFLWQADSLGPTRHVHTSNATNAPHQKPHTSGARLPGRPAPTFLLHHTHTLTATRTLGRSRHQAHFGAANHHCHAPITRTMRTLSRAGAMLTTAQLTACGPLHEAAMLCVCVL